jgi:hypothetical protein
MGAACVEATTTEMQTAMHHMDMQDMDMQDMDMQDMDMQAPGDQDAVATQLAEAFRMLAGRLALSSFPTRVQCDEPYRIWYHIERVSKADLETGQASSELDEPRSFSPVGGPLGLSCAEWMNPYLTSAQQLLGLLPVMDAPVSPCDGFLLSDSVLPRWEPDSTSSPGHLDLWCMQPRHLLNAQRVVVWQQQQHEPENSLLRITLVAAPDRLQHCTRSVFVGMTEVRDEGREIVEKHQKPEEGFQACSYHVPNLDLSDVWAHCAQELLRRGLTTPQTASDTTWTAEYTLHPRAEGELELYRLSGLRPTAGSAEGTDCKSSKLELSIAIAKQMHSAAPPPTPRRRWQTKHAPPAPEHILTPNRMLSCCKALSFQQQQSALSKTLLRPDVSADVDALVLVLQQHVEASHKRSGYLHTPLEVCRSRLMRMSAAVFDLREMPRDGGNSARLADMDDSGHQLAEARRILQTHRAWVAALIRALAPHELTCQKERRFAQWLCTSVDDVLCTIDEPHHVASDQLSPAQRSSETQQRSLVQRGSRPNLHARPLPPAPAPPVATSAAAAKLCRMEEMLKGCVWCNPALTNHKVPNSEAMTTFMHRGLPTPMAQRHAENRVPIFQVLVAYLASDHATARSHALEIVQSVRDARDAIASLRSDSQRGYRHRQGGALRAAAVTSKGFAGGNNRGAGEALQRKFDRLKEGWINAMSDTNHPASVLRLVLGSGKGREAAADLRDLSALTGVQQ